MINQGTIPIIEVYQGLIPIKSVAKGNEIFNIIDEPVADYIPLDYIESTKTQYIDTGYYVKYGDVITVDMNFIDTQSYFGYYSSSTNRVGIGVAKGAFEIIGGTNSMKMAPASDNERHTFVIDTTGKLKFDDTETTVTPMATDFASAYSFTLFGRKQSETNVSYKGQHRIHRFTVENNGELIMNLMPYERTKDGVAGLLDTVSGTFYTNNGTGSFIGSRGLEFLTADGNAFKTSDGNAFLVKGE